MKLYFKAGACSLATRILLNEIGLSYETESVDLKTHVTESGVDFYSINAKGYVPMLVLDDGTTLTENPAILSWLSSQSESFKPKDALAQAKLVEMLCYLSSEVHKSFSPLFRPITDSDKAAALERIKARFDLLTSNLKADYLLGSEISAADILLTVFITWARNLGVDVPAPLGALADRVKGRQAVKKAFEQEGLA